MRRNLLDCDAARHLRYDFPFGQTHDWLLWRRCPAGDPPSVIPRYGVVRNTRKAASQLHGGGQFAISLVDLPYGSCVGFGDDIHTERMATQSPGHKQICNQAPCLSRRARLSRQPR
jgi:hypothetical protein